MKRVVFAGLCLLAILIALNVRYAKTPGSAGTAPATPNPRTNVTIEQWADLYPNEYKDWKDSVHGTAYLAGNSDAPGCVSCHDDPSSPEIRTSQYRLEIPTRCARCHADANLTAKYQFAADTYTSYRADYHGTTIEFYRRTDPSIWRYEAVCSDCHRSHAVYGPDDPRSSVAAANLLGTCQKCHLGASPHFADAASGHFRTDATAAPLVYYVGIFYKVLIPVVLGGMLAYIALDVIHRLRSRVRRDVL